MLALNLQHILFVRRIDGLTDAWNAATICTMQAEGVRPNAKALDQSWDTADILDHAPAERLALARHLATTTSPSLVQTGRCAILFPHGVLFRNEETEMRRALSRCLMASWPMGAAIHE